MPTSCLAHSRLVRWLGLRRGLRGPSLGADVAAIDAAMEQHAVLVFRDQPLTDEQQLAFTRQFGQIERYETPGHIGKGEQERLDVASPTFPI